MPSTHYPSSPLAFTISQNKLWRTRDFEAESPTWETIANTQTSPLNGQATELKDFLTIGSDLYLLTDEGLWRTKRLSRSPKFIRKQTITNGRLLRQVGKTGLAVYGGVTDWEHTFDFTQNNGGFSLHAPDTHHQPTQYLAKYTAGKYWGSDEAFWYPNPNLTNTLGKYQEMLSIRRDFDPFLIRGVEIEYAFKNATPPYGGYEWWEPYNNVVLWNGNNTLDDLFVLERSDETADPDTFIIRNTGAMYDPPKPADRLYIRMICGDAWLGTPDHPTGVLWEEVINGFISVKRLTVYGHGFNPFVSPSPSGQLKVYYSSHRGETITELTVGTDKGDTGYDCDDFGLGVHLAAADNRIYYTTSYTGSFQTVPGLPLPVSNVKIRCLRVPFRQIEATKKLNGKKHDLHFIYGVSQPINNHTLFKVRFNATTGTLIASVPITPIINGTTYKLVEGNGNQLETFGGDSRKMVGFFEPIGGGNVVLLGSEDGGTSWAIRNAEFDGDQVYFVDPLQGGKGNQIWVAGASGVAFSNNGGIQLVAKKDSNPYLKIAGPVVTSLPVHKPNGLIQQISDAILDNFQNVVEWLLNGADALPSGGTCSPTDLAGNNPIRLRDGVKLWAETDLEVQSPAAPLLFTRTYDESQQSNAQFQFMGVGWTHNHFYKLLSPTGTAPEREIEIRLPSGGNLKLEEDPDNANHYEALDGSAATLVYASNQYTLSFPDGTALLFNNAGELVTRSWPQNEVWTYVHTNGKLTEVQDGYGRKLQFSYRSNPGQFDDGQLWRVGDQTATGLSTGSPSGRYVELSYLSQKSNGSPISGAKALLATLKDVRGQTWTYTYYGQVSDESDANLLHRLMKRVSPSLDTTGDGVLDETLTLEQLTYGTFANGKPVSLTQHRGNGLMSTLYEFPNLVEDAIEDRLYTTETTAQKTITHHFANDGGEVGLYLYSENALEQGGQAVLDINYQPTLRQDALGNETLLKWDATGKNLETAINALGQTTQFVYNSNDTLQYSIDAEGRKTRYYYTDVDQLRLPSEIKVFNNVAEMLTLQRQTFDYDNKGHVLFDRLLDPTTGSILREVTRSYYQTGSGVGLLQTVTQEDQDQQDDQITTYFYDDYGRVVQVNQSSTFGNCAMSRTVYDAAGNVVASICNYDNAGAHPTTAAEAVALRQATSDPNLNRVTTHEYDPLRRRFKTTINAGTSFALTTLTVYDALGRVIRTIVNYNSATSGVTQPFTAAHNAFGHGTDSLDNQVTDTLYNQRGQVKKQLDLLGNVTLLGYDDAGRLVKTVRNASQPNYNNDYSGGDYSLSSYVANTAADQDLIATNEYNANGSLIRSVDVLGRVSLTGYDALNRVVKTIQNASQPTYSLIADPDLSEYVPVADPDQDFISTTDYDVSGNIIRTTDVSGSITLYGYDTLGQQIKVIRSASQPNYNLTLDPDLSDYSPSSDADKDIISTAIYDAQRRAFQNVDVNGLVSRVAFDGLGRQVKSVTGYIAPAGVNGDPATWTWDSGQTRWEDNANNAISHGTNNDENIISQTAYDTEGRVKWTLDTLGRYTLFGYDDLNRRVRVIRNATNPTYNTGTDPDLSSYTLSGAADTDRLTQTVYDNEGRVAITIDERGNRTFYVYDKLGRQIKTVRNAKDAATIALNPGDGGYNAGNDPRSASYTVSSETDRDLITRTTYDFAGRVVSTFDPEGRETRREYDLAGRVVKNIVNYINGVFSAAAPDEDLISTTVYNKAGQVLSTTDPRGTKTSLTYDAAGRRLTVTRAAETTLAVTDYTCYDKAGRVLRVIQNWNGMGEPDARDGQGNWTFNPFNHGMNHDENRVTAYVHDALGRETKRIDPSGNEVLTVYAKDGRVVSTTDPEGSVTVHRYDKLRRIRRSVQGFQDNGVDPANWLWSSPNNRWENGSGTAIAFGTQHDRNHIADMTYDRAGHRLSQRNSRGALTTYTYDKLDRRTALVNPLTQDWASTYADVNGGYKVTLNDPQNFDTERIFDRLGRLKNINYLNETPKLTPNVTFTYDRLGNRTKMSEMAASLVRETFYTYDDMNRLTQVDFDTDGDVAIEQTVTYEYDAGGLRTKLTLPGNLSVTYTYDARGQLISLQDWDNQTTTYEYDKASRPIRTRRSNGFTTYSRYDEKGLLRWLQHLSPDELLQEFSFNVDKRGNRTLVREAKSQPTANNLIIPADDARVNFYKGEWTTNSVYRVSDTLTAALAIAFYGKHITLTFGTGSDCGICDVYLDQNLWGSVDTYAASAGEITVSLSAYNTTGHILEIHNRRAKHPASSGHKLSFKQAEIIGSFYQHTLQHSYDTASRLTQSAYRNGVATSGTPFRQYEFEYDLNSNRTRQKVSLNGVVSSDVNYSYNLADQLTSDGVNTYGYDANGNLATINGSPAYTWDRANRLLSYGGSAYTYNGVGQRISQTIGANTTQYLQDVQPALYKVLSATTGANTTRYVHDPMGIYSQENPDGSWRWMVNDGLGSVRHVVDNNANILASAQYAPYGEVWDGSVASQTGFGYTNEFTDSNGLVYLRARHFNPSLGVFPNLDALETSNLYVYSDSNPINLTDPSGQSPLCVPPNLRNLTPQYPIPRPLECHLECWDAWKKAVINSHGDNASILFAEINRENCLAGCGNIVGDRNQPAIQASVIVKIGGNSRGSCQVKDDEFMVGMGTLAYSAKGDGLWTHTHFSDGSYEPEDNLNEIKKCDWIQVEGDRGTRKFDTSKLDRQKLIDDKEGLVLTSPDIQFIISHHTIATPVRADFRANEGHIIHRDDFVLVAYMREPTTPFQTKHCPRYSHCSIKLRVAQVIATPALTEARIRRLTGDPKYYSLEEHFTQPGDSGGGVFKINNNGETVLVGTHLGERNNVSAFTPIGDD